MSAETRRREMGQRWRQQVKLQQATTLLLLLCLGTGNKWGLPARISVEAFQYYLPTCSSGTSHRLATLMKDYSSPFGTRTCYPRGVFPTTSMTAAYARGSGGRDGKKEADEQGKVFGRVKNAWDELTGWGMNGQEPSSSSSMSRPYKKKKSGAARAVVAAAGRGAKSENSPWGRFRGMFSMDLPTEHLSQSSSSSSSSKMTQAKSKSGVSSKSVYHTADPQKLIRLTEYLKRGPALPTSTTASSSSSSSSSPTPLVVPPRGVSLDQLVREWTVMNKDPRDCSASASAAAPPPLVPASPAPKPPSVASSSLHEQRTERVAAASTAGQSSWGEMESKRAQQQMLGGSPPDSVPARLPGAARGTTTASASMMADQLAQEWAAINRDVVEPKPAPVAAAPPPASISKPVDVPPLTAAPAAAAAAPVARGAITTSPAMDDLAKAWGAMNKEIDSPKPTPPIPYSPPPSQPQQKAAPASAVPPAPIIPRGATTSMDDLAKAWGSMNREADSLKPIPPMAISSPPSQPTTTAPAPPSPVARGASTKPLTDDLAKAWGAMNKEIDSHSPPPSQPQQKAAPASAVPAAPIPRGATTSMDDLAKAWGSMNREADSPKPIPPLAISSSPSQTMTTAPAPPSPAKPFIDDLAKAWGAMNKETDSPKPTPQIPDSPPPQSQPKAAPAAAAALPASAHAGATTSMDDLAKAWSSMNTDQEAAPRLPNVKPPAAFVQPPYLVEESSSTSSTPAPAAMLMDDLAKAWASRNTDPDAAPRLPNMKK